MVPPEGGAARAPVSESGEGPASGPMGASGGSIDGKAAFSKSVAVGDFGAMSGGRAELVAGAYAVRDAYVRRGISDVMHASSISGMLAAGHGLEIQMTLDANLTYMSGSFFVGRGLVAGVSTTFEVGASLGSDEGWTLRGSGVLAGGTGVEGSYSLSANGGPLQGRQNASGSLGVSQVSGYGVSITPLVFGYTFV